MSKSVFLSVIFLFLYLTSFGQIRDTLFTTESALPDLNLLNLKGESTNLLQYGENNTITVFSFWATWCIPCKKELNNLADLYEEWQGKYDVEIIAISVDNSRSQAKVKSTVDASNWPFEVLLDPNEDVKRAFNFQLIPHTIAFDKSGQLGYTHSGYVEGDEFELEKQISEMNGGAKKDSGETKKKKKKKG